MIVNSCAFTVNFPTCNNIREHIFDLEKHFSDFQKPFTLVPLPFDAPAEIPRIIAMSLYGHSQLLITTSSVQVTTNFDSKYNTDISRCIEYIKGKCEKIVSSLKVIGSEKGGYYSGLQISLLFGKEDGVDDPISFLSGNYLNFKTNLSMDEVQLRTALVAEGKYYINITLQNYREFTKGPDERGSIVDADVRKSCLLAVLDINDRYAFNTRQGYISTPESVNGVIELSEKVSGISLKQLIEEGVFKYE